MTTYSELVISLVVVRSTATAFRPDTVHRVVTAGVHDADRARTKRADMAGTSGRRKPSPVRAASVRVSYLAAPARSQTPRDIKTTVRTSIVTAAAAPVFLRKREADRLHWSDQKFNNSLTLRLFLLQIYHLRSILKLLAQYNEL